MSEASFWDYLRKLLPPGRYSRIESHDTAPGLPDVSYTVEGVSGTIELKDAKKPGAKFPFSGRSGLRAAQIRWIREELQAGGKVVLALQCGERVYLLDCHAYYTYYAELHQMTEDEIARIADKWWRKGKSSPDILVPDQVREVLTERS